jgi:hypothetical protein
VRYGLLLLLTTISCLSQTVPPGTAQTTGRCSPAVSGNRNTFTINCGIGKAQGEMLLKIVNKILANQTDLKKFGNELDEILTGVNALRKSSLESLPRADLHVDDVTIEIQDYSKAYGLMSGLPGSSLPALVVAHISGRNQSPFTPTEPYPIVEASVAARPFIPGNHLEDEEDLFIHGGWANEAYVGFPYVLNPLQTFSFSKRYILSVLDAKGVKDTGNIFFDTWNALQRGDVVLYVVTRATFSDKWGNLPKVKTCSIFIASDNFSKRRTCAGQFKIGMYQP